LRTKVKKYLPIAAGILLAGLPLAAFSYWFDGSIEQKVRFETQLNSSRTMAVINSRLTRASAALNDLAARGITTCSSEHIEALRKTAFVTSPLKELSIVGADGKTMCNDTGLQLAPPLVVGTPYQTKVPNITLDVLHLTDVDQNMVRLRRRLPDGGSIAALVPADVFIPIAAKDAAVGNSHVRVTGADGAAIANINSKVIADAQPDDLYSTTSESESFGLRATVSNTRSQVASKNPEVRIGGFLVCGAIGVAILGMMAFFMRWQQRNDPTAEFAAALQRGEFVPYYQPIIDIVSGKLIGAEVLVRWRKPDGKMVSPGAFIHIMEQNGLIRDLTHHLMRQSCIDIGPSYALRPHLRVSFNLTAEQFENDATVGEIKSIFAKGPLKFSQIVLELTERQEPKSFSKTRQVIASLQVLGCKVSLDDVGTGHSGLSSILKLGVDIIKIDKMFVDSMDDDRNSAAIIGTLVDLARKLGMDIVAEGVERFEQVTELRRRGIRMAQGFVFAPALPAQAFLQLVDAITPQQEVAAERPSQLQAGILRAVSA
jgi:sensor c-di-GMP phosphodiesterase-like protein